MMSGETMRREMPGRNPKGSTSPATPAALIFLPRPDRIGRRNLLILPTEDNVSYLLCKKRGGRLEVVRNLTSLRPATAMPFFDDQKPAAL